MKYAKVVTVIMERTYSYKNHESVKFRTCFASSRQKTIIRFHNRSIKAPHSDSRIRTNKINDDRST